jgi:alkylation response protein AidB-like acyl-CoA dehydrogenase
MATQAWTMPPRRRRRRAKTTITREAQCDERHSPAMASASRFVACRRGRRKYQNGQRTPGGQGLMKERGREKVARDFELVGRGAPAECVPSPALSQENGRVRVVQRVSIIGRR